MGFLENLFVGAIAIILSPILVPIAIFTDWLDKQENIIALDGKSMSGKDTLINILSGKGFIKNHKATPGNQMLQMKIKYDSIEFAVTEFHNVSGDDKANAEKEALIDRIFSDKYANKDIWFIYIFDADLYQNDTQEMRDIKSEIKAFLKEIKDKNQNREKKINFKVLGTRGDKITSYKKSGLENEIRKLGVECQIFDMTKNPKNELAEYIIKG